MPRVSAWAQRGLRLRHHYANSHCSHFGLYSILYGRHPLTYVSTLEAKVPAQLCGSMRQAGYETHLLTSGTLHWQRMDRYLSPLNFDHIVTDLQGTWPERDRRVLAKLSALTHSERPVFAMAFLMSTHFDYAYPPKYERNTPAAEGSQEMWSARWKGLADRKEASERTRIRWLNRYRNALAFMDDLVGEFLEGLDRERCLVVLTGDHGESFFDDGTWLHSSRLSEIQTRVPCAIVGPGVQPAERTLPSAHVDLLPTLLGLLGAKQRLQHAQGFDLSGGGPRGAPVLLANENLRELALLVPKAGRLHLHVSPDRAQLRSHGFLDEHGRLLLSRPSGRSAGWWAEQVEGVLARMAR